MAAMTFANRIVGYAPVAFAAVAWLSMDVIGTWASAIGMIAAALLATYVWHVRNHVDWGTALFMAITIGAIAGTLGFILGTIVELVDQWLKAEREMDFVAVIRFAGYCAFVVGVIASCTFWVDDRQRNDHNGPTSP